MNNYIKYPLTAIFGFILCLFFLKECDKQTYLPIKNDTLTSNQNKNIDSIHNSERIIVSLNIQIDSLKLLKSIVKTRIIHHYTTLHDSIPYTLQDDLDSLNQDWLDMEVINLNVIGRQDSIITVMGKEIELYKAIAHNDTLRMQDQADSLKSNRKFWRGFKYGAITGLGLGAAIYVGSKIKP